MIALLNAAPDTGNQGVSALCASAVDGLTRRGLDRIAVADHGRGRRAGPGTTERFGLSHTRRLWRGDCLRTVRALAPLGGMGSASAQVVAQSRAVLDVSGGDSFTTLYGAKRFGAMTLSKRAALASGRPLVLLPQTLGPFHGATARREAAAILRRAAGVWVRDARSEALLQDLLGADYDTARHHRGPDMAVLLPATQPKDLPRVITQWLAQDRTAPVAGLNVSGLLWQQDDEARRTFGLAQSHRAQIETAARAILDSDPEMRLLLVPHVIRPEGDPESDLTAAVSLAARLGEYGERVMVLPQNHTASELKWVLSRLDWFAGARMHATIGAFSSGVPTLGLGYSDKASGVFTECGIGDEVADLRTHTAEDLGAAVIASVARRAQSRAALAKLLPQVKARAEAQMDDIAACIRRVSK